MLKDFKNIIEDLGLGEKKFKNYTVVATCFKKYDEKKMKKIGIDLPKNEKELIASEKFDKPVFEIILDDNDPELCFITKYLPEEVDIPDTPMIWSEFYERIFSLPEELSKYEVLSSAWEHLDENYTGRYDIPINAVLVNEEQERICCVEIAT
jgi:hypothetical protein